MTDNVISIGTRKPLEEDKAELRRAEKMREKHLVEAADNHQKNLLELLDNTKKRVMDGQLDGLVIAGRNPENGAFMSVVALNTSSTRVDTYLAYAGILSAMQIDMVDLSSSGPHMNPDGSYFALGEAQEIEMEDDE